MALNLYFNATPLLLPKTGIHQYASGLLSRISRIDEITAHYFYLAGWSDDLIRPSQVQGGSRLWKLKNAIRDRFPYSLELQHRLRGRLFRRGLQSERDGIYHELNFLPFATRLPTVITVHDLSVLRFPQTHPAARVKFMDRRLPQAVAQAAMIITDSGHVREEVLQEYSLPPVKVVAVPLAASEEFSPQPPKAVKTVLARYALSDQHYLLAVGTLEPRKNLITAIHAFSGLPDRLRKEFPLVLAGLRGWENEEFDRILRPLQARGELRVPGFVPEADLPALYSGATAFIYPSLYEGFGLPPLEAMACGTPVITSNRASLPEVVGDAGIQLEATDVDGLSQAMRTLIEDPTERERLSKLGLQRCRLFSWERTAAETIAVYWKARQV